MMRLPAVFLSHGAPDLVLHDLPARRFLDHLARGLPKPEAILVVSAHFVSAAPKVTAMDKPRTIHDFSGFDSRLHSMVYPAAGAPELATRIIALLRSAGYDATADHAWGLDHGAWIPLCRVYPAADIPVIELSIHPGGDARRHTALGRALAELRDEGVLIIGSGSVSHNLGRLRPPPANAEPPEWVTAFVEWTAHKLAASDEEALLDYRMMAPRARDNHPTDEHFLPLFVVMGAAGPEWRAERLHHSVTYGVLAMDAFQFD